MSDLPATILLIEDEAPIRKFLRITLDAHGYKLVEADTAKLGLIEAAQCQPDVILLDLGLPDGDGVDLTRRLREFLSVPIIIISARGREQDKINALDPENPVYEHLDLQVNLAARSVMLAGQALHLTPNEYRLLTVLIRNQGRVLTHQYLLREVWGPGASTESHYVRVYINQLREKLGDSTSNPRFIHTETGVGYRFGSQQVG